ncbi:hypothetical protein BH10ACT1_BH10ACT1_29710 [soil metagenome]
MIAPGPGRAGGRPVVALRALEPESVLRARATSRHPAARGGASHLVAAVERIGPAALGITGPHTAAAAALIAVRGAQLRSQAAFAAAYGLAAEQVAAIEAGAVEPGRVPAPVRLLTPFPLLLASLLGSDQPRWHGPGTPTGG